MTGNHRFQLFRKRMQQENISEIFINNFENYYNKLVSGETGLISENEITPVESLPDYRMLGEPQRKTGQKNLSRTIFLKLNGGLGTSMGLERAKSLLKVRGKYTFLDVIAQQSIIGGFRLLLMNSFSTSADSLSFLKKYPALWGEIPLDFVQHKEPKVDPADFRPVAWPRDPNLEWCPPGHGDLYISIFTSGILEKLLEKGYRYAFISNADNLGAILDPAILGYFAENEIPFMMEVAERTEADKKGGHLARLKNGRFILREIAQCSPEELESFQNIGKYKYFNTNNLWIHLPALEKILVNNNYILDLPMIRNRKNVDPRDQDSPIIYQLETAVGSAISLFEGSSALRVPRSRFSPVKNTNDLLAVRSNLFELSPEFLVRIIPERQDGSIEISLDQSHYKLIDNFEARFPHGSPSLKECTQLKIDGDVMFGKNVNLKNKVHIINRSKEQATIRNNSQLEGQIIL
jgi:UTP--glucose-1-phosphate uridylyltransferase